MQGYFTGCDTVPSFYEELRVTGNDLDLGVFKPVEPATPRTRQAAEAFE